MFGVGEITYWLICVGVIALMGSLIFVAWWALFADRPRGRRRCPRCWYDMAHAPPPGMTCAECGFIAKREQQFHRTRRRYGLAGGAILLNVAIALFITERSMQSGFTALLPTRMLIWSLPLSDDPNTGLFGELLQRARRGMLSDGQWESFIARCAEGDWRAQPIDDAWQEKYGQCIVGFRQMLADQPRLEALLLQIPPDVRLSVRDEWPLDVPVTVLFQMQEWWPQGAECRVRVKPRLEGAKPLVAYRNDIGRWARTALRIELPPLDPSTTEIIIDVQIDRRTKSTSTSASGESGEAERDDERHPWTEVFSKSMRIAVKVAGTVEQAATPVANELLNHAIAQVFESGVIKWRDGDSPVRFSVDAQSTFTPAFANTAVGLRVELLRDGEVARRLLMWWQGGVKRGSNEFDGRNYGYEVDFEAPDLLKQLSRGDELGRWKLRITGDPLIALRAGKTEKYWAGTVSIPVPMMERRGEAPLPPWQIEHDSQ